MDERLVNGTLVRWHSGGNTMHGFVVGTCSYDLAGDDNAYVCRYAMRPGDESPRRPYAVVDVKSVEPVTDWPKDFFVGGHWGASPQDRVDEWDTCKDESGHVIVVSQDTRGKS